MYIPTPYFKSVPYFGDLTLDYIFVKDKSPLLFTCIANNNMYLCLCYDNRIEQKWAISPIDVEMLRKSLKKAKSEGRTKDIKIIKSTF